MSAVVPRCLSSPNVTYVEIFLGEIVVDILNSESCAAGFSAENKS
jgi:hypothetical protein